MVDSWLWSTIGATQGPESKAFREFRSSCGRGGDSLILVPLGSTSTIFHSSVLSGPLPVAGFSKLVGARILERGVFRWRKSGRQWGSVFEVFNPRLQIESQVSRTNPSRSTWQDLRSCVRDLMLSQIIKTEWYLTTWTGSETKPWVSGERTGLVGQPPPPLAPPLQGGGESASVSLARCGGDRAGWATITPTGPTFTKGGKADVECVRSPRRSLAPCQAKA